VIGDNLCLGRNKSLSLKGVPTPTADRTLSTRSSCLLTHSFLCLRLTAFLPYLPMPCGLSSDFFIVTVPRQQSLRSRRPVETSIVGESSSEDACFYFQFVLFSLNTPICPNRQKRNVWVSSLDVASRLYTCKAPPSYLLVRFEYPMPVLDSDMHPLPTRQPSFSYLAT
jgi:hypothetical protein